MFEILLRRNVCLRFVFVSERVRRIELCPLALRYVKFIMLALNGVGRQTVNTIAAYFACGIGPTLALRRRLSLAFGRCGLARFFLEAVDERYRQVAL